VCPSIRKRTRPVRLNRVLYSFLLAVSCSLGLDLTRFRVARAVAVTQSLSLYSDARFLQGGGKPRTFVSLDPRYSLESDSRSDNRNLSWNLSADAWLFREDSFTHVLPTIQAGYSLEAYVGRGAAFLGPRVDVSCSPAYREEPFEDYYVQRTLDVQAEAHPGLTLGVGRIRDAWPLLKARRISDILVAEGVIDRGLSDDELLDLSQFISRAWRLFALHDRPARFYYDSLETRLART